MVEKSIEQCSSKASKEAERFWKMQRKNPNQYLFNSDQTDNKKNNRNFSFRNVNG